MKECRNLDCDYNNKGYCSKEAVNAGRTVFNTLTSSQWMLIRKTIEKKSNKGCKPNKRCKNTHCINNIKGYCFLPSEIEALSIIL